MSPGVRTLVPRVVALGAMLWFGSWAGRTAGQEPGGLTIPDFGVGTEVVDHELTGKADRFDEGRQVVFWTRVDGGEEGQRIQHVWIRDGEEQIAIGLTLGGAQWRTFSRKTLHPGSVGKWAVEARDGDERVLARAEFECVAGGASAAGDPDAP